MTKPIENIGDEEIVYQGKIIEVVNQKVKTGDKEQVFEYARRSPGTRLIITTPEGKILLTKEYRQEHDSYDYRLPGGKVFDRLEDYNQFLKSGQDILEQAQAAAIKEAKEEAGIDVKEINYYTTSRAGATVVWDLFYFAVSSFEKRAGGQELEHGEDIEVAEVSFEDAIKICLDGQMKEDRSMAVLMRYLHVLKSKLDFRK
jgi:ADP-ribose pyrophosphatase